MIKIGIKWPEINWLGVLGVVVMLVYGLGIFLAAWYTFWAAGAPKPDDMPGFVTLFVSGMNGLMAANLGALLGIKIVRAFRGSIEPIQWLQQLAAVFYVLMLIAASVFWGMAGWTSDSSKIVSLLPEMTKTATGILLAIFGSELGIQHVKKIGNLVAK